MEEAVFLNIKEKKQAFDPGLIESFHKDREEIYNRQSATEKNQEQAFLSFYQDFFCKIGLKQIFDEILAEFPVLRHNDVAIFVKRVWNRKQEDAQLYVREAAKTVVISIQAVRTLNRVTLAAFLRHEFMHVADMLSPEFFYSPELSLGGSNEMEDNLIRERFRILWNLYIDSRLRRKNSDTPSSQQKEEFEFKKAFSFLPKGEQKIIYNKVTEADRLTQADLLTCAIDKKTKKTFDEGGLLCPLCFFPSYDQIKNWPEDILWVAEEIKKEFPSWHPSSGVCTQCFELYQSRLKIT